MSVPQKIKALFNCVQTNINSFVSFLVEIVITNSVGEWTDCKLSFQFSMIFDLDSVMKYV